MNEFDPTLSTSKADRYLPRAEWQRTIGACLMNSLIGDAFDEPVILTEREYKTIDYHAVKEGGSEEYDDPELYLWDVAHQVSALTISTAFGRASQRQTNLLKAFDRSDTALMNNLFKFTFFGEVSGVLTEALRSMKHLPLNMLRHVVVAARNQDPPIQKYAFNTLTDLKTMLCMEDMRTMIGQAAVAHNGFWGAYSTSPGASFTSPLSNSGHRAFVFSENSVRLSADSLSVIRHKLQKNNRNALKSGELMEGSIGSMSSSGCPARHLEPANTIYNYPTELEELASALKVGIADLVAPRVENVIDSGLNIITHSLGGASDYFENVITQRRRQYGSRLRT